MLRFWKPQLRIMSPFLTKPSDVSCRLCYSSRTASACHQCPFHILVFFLEVCSMVRGTLCTTLFNLHCSNGKKFQYKCENSIFHVFFSASFFFKIMFRLLIFRLIIQKNKNTPHYFNFLFLCSALNCWTVSLFPSRGRPQPTTEPYVLKLNIKYYRELIYQVQHPSL